MLDFVASGQISELLLEHSPAAIAVFDNGMTYLGASRHWREDFGLDTREVAGLNHYELFPETPERWRAIHRRVMAGETLSSDVEPLVRQDGSTDWIEWQMMPWRDRSGEVGGAILFTSKLTDLVVTRRQEEVAQNALDLMIDSAADYAIAMTDTSGLVTYWSVGAERIYGWKEAEILGQSAMVLLPPEQWDEEIVTRRLGIAQAEGVFRERAARVRKDGSRFMVDAYLSPIRNGAGELVGFTAVTRDITRELASQAAVEASAAQMQAILETVPDAMVTIDETGIIESFSATAEKVFGYSAAEVIGRNVAMLMPVAEAALHNEYLARYRETGKRWAIGNTRRVTGRRKDGSEFPHELSVGEASANGRRIFTGFIRDLTEREDGERHLRELQSELSQISRVSAVATLATALAHELNQPLTAIAGYVQTAAALIPSPQGSRDQELHFALIEAGREAIRAGQIIRRLREFISSGALDRRRVTTEDLIAEACSLGFVGGRAANISCSQIVPSGLPALLVDPVQIQQVIVNLILNAIHAAGPGGWVRGEAMPGGSFVKIAVIDSGPGVPADAVASLFDPFVTSKTDGMGLGLAICRTIVELHGGDLWYESAPGGGAAFLFTIPIMAETEDG